MKFPQVFLEIPPAREGERTVFIELTVTSSLDITLSTDISSHPTISGDTVSDNAIRQPKTFRISGLISDTLNTALITAGFQRTVAANLNLLEKVSERSMLVIFHYDNANRQAPLENGIITNLKFSKTSGMNTSYNVEMTVQEVILTNRPLISTEQFTTDEVANQHSDKGDTKPVATTDRDSFSLFATLSDFNIFSVVSSEIVSIAGGGQ